MSSFWQGVLLLIFVVPLFVLLAAAVWDIFRRRDMRMLGKALWLVALCIFPILGPLVYLVIRPPGTTARELEVDAEAASTQHLAALADLHDRGKLTDEEFRAAKARTVGPGAVVPGTVREQRGGQLL